MPPGPEPASATEARSSLSDSSDILLHAPAPLVDDLYALVTSGALHYAEGLALLSRESFSQPVPSTTLATFDSWPPNAPQNRPKYGYFEMKWYAHKIYIG